jgi:cytochrome bd ubiquinol oxidase subunit II
LSPFALACGFGLIAGYALLGAGWLIFKTEGGTATFARKIARPALIATLAFIVFISLWTPITHTTIEQRWFSVPNILFLWPVPLLTGFIAWRIWASIDGTREARTFLFSIALFLLALFGLGISLFPYAVPPSLTIWQAAASTPTLRFIGVGVVIILPITLAYLAYAHWIFRGKAGAAYGSE